MGDVIESFASGIAAFIGNLFRSPLDFITGKSCSSICTSPWDFFCHIEHFCVVNLLKMAAVLILLYIVLLFLYLLYKLRICKFVGKSLCHVAWGCFSCCFSLCKGWLCCCKLLRNTHERHYRRSMYSGESVSRRVCRSQPCRRSVHLRKSLRPRSHRSVVIRMDRQLSHGRRRRRHGGSSVHGIRVLRESKFSRKGSSFRAVDKRRKK